MYEHPTTAIESTGKYEIEHRRKKHPPPPGRNNVKIIINKLKSDFQESEMGPYPLSTEGGGGGRSKFAKFTFLNRFLKLGFRYFMTS